MNKKHFFPISVVFLILSISESYAQYQWPFPVQNQQGQVTGSVGEYRYTVSSNTHRFHQGVDLTNSGNRDVHTINSGNVTWNGSAGISSIIAVMSTNGQIFEYIHIYPRAEIVSGQMTAVNIGDYLGEMIIAANWATHLHLQEETTNFLDHNLYPYVDAAPPYFSTTVLSNAVRFYQNGLIKTTANADNLLLNQQVNLSGTPHTVIYEKVDISTHAIDPRVNSDGSNGGGQIVPSEISWHAVDFRNQTVIDERLRFDGIPNNDSALPSFHPLSAHPGSPSVHIITSHPRILPYDRFWNTRLRLGQTETWQIGGRPAILDATVNLQAAYPDGTYTMRFNAYDVDYDNDPNQTAAQRQVNIIVDNFRPYIKEVIVRKNGEFGRIVYRGYWQWNNSLSSLELIQTTGDDAGPEDLIWIKITTSEPTQNLTINIPSVDGTAYYETTTIDNTNNTEFFAQYNPITVSAPQQINIQAEDLAGNPLQTNPAQIPVRAANGTWGTGVSAGADSNHGFNTGSGICSDGGGSGGRMASNGRSSGCLYVDFSADKSNPSLHEVVNFTPVVSGNGLITYNWNFGSGAIPATSTGSGPQAVIYNTNGMKTVSLEICDNSGGCLTETKTAVVNVGAPPSQLAVDFSADRLGANVGDNIQLTSTVTGAVGTVSYSWSFGEGLSLGHFADVNPLIAYNTPGNKTVKLTVTDANGSVTKVKNSYLLINSSTFNIGVTITGCGPTNGTGTTSFGSFVTGGNGHPYDTYFWDFGDGTSLTTTSSTSVSHTYKKSGKYTVRLTVCDETSCGTAESVDCASVPAVVDNSTLNPDFLIGDLPPLAPPYKVSLNSPVKFTNATTGGGNPNDFTYSWDFESHYWGGTTESANPATNQTDGPIAQEVYYTTIGRKEVTLVVDNGIDSRTKTIPDALEVVTGMGSGTCYATIGEITVSSTCWTSSNPPQFTIPISVSNCPVAKTEVIYWSSPGTGVVLPGRRLDFAAMGLSTPSFPLTADFSFAAYQFDGLNYNRIGYKRQRFTIYGPVTADAGPDKQVCEGSSLSLTATGSSNNSYQWTASPSSAIDFISSTNVLNPVFMGVEKGTYIYGLRSTGLESGCVSSADNVTIVVDKPEISPTTFYASQNTNIALNMSTSGGFGNNTYLWTPPDNLNSSNILSPIFSSTTEGEFNYAVYATDQLGCQAQTQVIVNASNSPGNLQAVAESFNRVSLTWVDRSSSETNFVIQRAENGGGFFDLATVGQNTQNYDDINLSSGINYTYRVSAIVGGVNSGFTNEVSVNTGTLPLFSSLPAQGQRKYGDWDNDNDFDIVTIESGIAKIWINESGTYNLAQSIFLNYPTVRIDVGDFDNDNDLDILAMPFPSTGNYYSQIFINNTAVFSSINTDLNLIGTGEISFLDYDKDNDVDFFLGNSTNSSYFLGHNNSTSNVFTKILTDIPRVFPWNTSGNSMFAFADLDNDGDEDLISPKIDNSLYLYTSENGFLASRNFNILANCCSGGSIDVGDFDSDGKTDILQAGNGGTTSSKTTILKNYGNNQFIDVANGGITQFRHADVVWGDYDLDGDFDFLISGNLPSSQYKHEIYQNNSGVFSLSQSLDGSTKQEWIDYDGDGDLDILGADGQIHINNLGTNKNSKNLPPTPPLDLCFYFNGSEAAFSWADGTDNETPSSGLTYNLYVKQDGNFIMTPLSDLNSGFRKVQRNGNVDHNKSWIITLPSSSGLIEWGVQAIDNQYNGSAFSHYSTNFSSSSTIVNAELCNTYTGAKSFLAPVITAPQNCSSNTVVVPSGASLTLNAKNSIRLLPGFHVQSGGRLLARIVSDGGNVSCAPRNSSNARTVAFQDNAIVLEEEEKISEEGDIIKVFPNPSRNLFNISVHFDQMQEYVGIQVVNITGIILYERDFKGVFEIEDKIDLTGSSKGVYFIRLVTKSKTISRKLLKI